MKKIKMHLISIIVIFVMLFFGLATSHTISGELTIINNTENNLIFRITRIEYLSDTEYIENFTLQTGQDIKLKRFEGRNTFANRGLGIISFIIYDENHEIIKEYGIIHYENIPEFNFYRDLERRRRSERRVFYFIFNITDELLE
jgi:hypothetical protein